MARWIDSGRLPAQSRGRHRIVRRADLDRLALDDHSAPDLEAPLLERVLDVLGESCAVSGDVALTADHRRWARRPDAIVWTTRSALTARLSALECLGGIAASDQNAQVVGVVLRSGPEAVRVIALPGGIGHLVTRRGDRWRRLESGRALALAALEAAARERGGQRADLERLALLLLDPDTDLDSAWRTLGVESTEPISLVLDLRGEHVVTTSLGDLAAAARTLIAALVSRLAEVAPLLSTIEVRQRDLRRLGRSHWRLAAAGVPAASLDAGRLLGVVSSL